MERSSNHGVWGVISFRILITPALIRIMFVVGLVPCAFFAVPLLERAVSHGVYPFLMLRILFWLVAVPLAWRMICEMLIVIFRISNTLSELLDSEHRSREVLIEIRKHTSP